MGQQVWAHLSQTGESWTSTDLVRILEMPPSTVRGQLRRLLASGQVTRRDYFGRFLYRKTSPANRALNQLPRRS